MWLLDIKMSHKENKEITRMTRTIIMRKYLRAGSHSFFSMQTVHSVGYRCHLMCCVLNDPRCCIKGKRMCTHLPSTKTGCTNHMAAGCIIVQEENGSESYDCTHCSFHFSGLWEDKCYSLKKYYCSKTFQRVFISFIMYFEWGLWTEGKKGE